jgi:hypothetical protein
MSSKDLANVRLNLGGTAGSVVEINGVNYANSVAGVDVQASGWGPPKVTLSLVTHEVVVDGEAQVVIPEKTRDALLALGWSAPATPEEKSARDLVAKVSTLPIYQQIVEMAETRGLVLGGGSFEVEESDAFDRDVVRVRFTCDLAPPVSLKAPVEWAAELGLHVMDPDGWRADSKLGAKDWDEPVSRDEFRQRLTCCTVRPASGTWEQQGTAS